MFLESSMQTDTSPPERGRLAEANHRIANNLAAIAGLVRRRSASLAGAESLSAAEVRAVLAETTARVEAVARLHRILSDSRSDAPVELSAYLHQLATELVASLAERDTVTLHFVGEVGCRLAADRALYLGLIVIELVMNALKYAHPTGVAGKISIRCHRIVGAVVVEIADDGVGLPEGLDPFDSNTSGLGLVRSLARQIGGEVAFDSTSLGCRTTITAPLLTTV